jgi:hypothetical protein
MYIYVHTYTHAYARIYTETHTHTHTNTEREREREREREMASEQSIKAGVYSRDQGTPLVIRHCSKAFIPALQQHE